MRCIRISTDTLQSGGGTHMRLLKAVRQGFSIPTDNTELLRAQAQAVARYIPMMYAILVVNTVALALTHIGVAPVHLTLFVPGLLAGACMLRLTVWWRTRGRELNDAEAHLMLKTMVWVAGLLGLLFSGWALSLFPYSNAYQQAHIAFYMSIQTIGCFFCLMHVRPAAFLVALTVTVPFTTFFLLSGNPVLGAMAVNVALVAGGLMVLLHGNNRDFTELVNSRREMRQINIETLALSDANQRLANQDSLTGLPNRRRFLAALDEKLTEARVNGTQIAVGRLDLDSFRSVNDIFGEVCGNRVIVEAGQRLVTHCGKAGFVARHHGDVFALIVEGPAAEDRLQSIGQSICDTIRRPFVLQGATVRVSASLGLAASVPSDTAETLYDRADYACFVAKKGERGNAMVFAPRHASEISTLRALEHALATCDLDAEISIVFQPQFDVSLNRTIGYEVLARWINSALGEISPAVFIPLAERTGMIGKITQTVLQKAVSALLQLPAPLRLSVNLSANDICSQTAIDAIADLVRNSGVSPCRLDFEITETAAMLDFNQANAALETLLALGSRIALDDFGTGNSSLTYVQHLPLNQIKIDRSFVAKVTDSAPSKAIIQTTIDLCRNLGIDCVLEGIETTEQKQVLLELGGTIMQGYLFGRPVGLTQVLEQVTRGEAPLAATSH